MSLHVSWEQYNTLIERLALQVHESGWHFNQVICIARGGLRVGDVMSRIFELPLAILSTVPGVLVGVVLILWLTGTTLNIQSYMGAIMAVGISVANSILLVSFAEHARHEQKGVVASALDGATSRLRAILMTATAMICGMLPMAIGFGEGGAQSAPLGRAVVGGLLFSTITTLTVLPTIYAVLQGNAKTLSNSLNPEDPTSRYYANS